MTKRWTVLFTAVVLTVVACGTGGSSPSPGGTTSATSTPAGSPATSPTATSSGAATGSPGASGSAGASGSPGESGSPSGVTGDLKMGGWSAAGSTEETLLNSVLDTFEASHPGIAVTFTPLAEGYDANMLVQLGTDNAPD